MYKWLYDLYLNIFLYHITPLSTGFGTTVITKFLFAVTFQLKKDVWILDIRPGISYPLEPCVFFIPDDELDDVTWM